jgi:hypothetical protein
MDYKRQLREGIVLVVRFHWDKRLTHGLEICLRLL